jgi:vanillate O-demethylase monooxygenase subunit
MNDGTGWTPLARSADVGRTVLSRQVSRGGMSWTVLLWRTKRGQAVAMDARCPHRDYPMRDPRLVGDALECPVHGFRFGPTGRCVNMRRARPARVLQVREAGGYVWLAP